MDEVRAEQAQQQEEEKTRLEKNLKVVAQIEDAPLQEDIQRTYLQPPEPGHCAIQTTDARCCQRSWGGTSDRW